MAGKLSSRIKRAISSSLALFAVAGILAASNAYIQNRDRQLALGPQSKAQEDFFANAVDRPDAVAFFKRFTPSQKLRVAQNLRNHDNPDMIRIAAIWLSDFDANARQELAEVVKDLTPKFPDVGAEQLGHTGGFQKLAVFAALRAASDKTLPFVIQQLGVPERRANAVEYLASVGPKAGPLLESKLADKDREVRLAATDALGKIAYRPAAPKIRQLLRAAEQADRSPILASLANLGDPASEPIFASLAKNPNLPAADRASVFLGLARIGSRSAVDALAKLATNGPPDKPQILESLSLAGDAGLAAQLPQKDLLEVAGGIQSQKADSIIVQALSNPNLRTRAAELALGRPRVAPALTLLLIGGEKLSGSTVERIVDALASTAEGRAAFKRANLEQKYRGFMQRALSRD